MKAITFNYTKKNGEHSNRILLATVFPGDKVAGIDVSQLDTESAGEFMALALTLHTEYVTKLKELQDRYDLTHNYRQFFKDKMTDVITVAE